MEVINVDKRPNIVFVLTDDQGYGDLGCMGNPVVRTPNIDNFHNESIRLTNFHVGPTCAPTRASLLTGHYANSTGVWHTVGGRSLLRKNEWTLASALREYGYRTAIFGKWHLGDEYPYRPIDRGFEKAIVHGGGGIGQTPDYWGNDYFNDTYYVNGSLKKFTGYCTDVFFEEALKFINHNSNSPFFCYISTNAPHSPYNVEKKYFMMYESKVSDERARFYGMITNIDENFGMLRKMLRKWNLDKNTILIFMTDNGTSCGVRVDSRGYAFDGYNAGLRGMKNSEYDGGHRVPFFLRWPGGKLDYGKDINELTAGIDFMPTLLDLCNIPGKEELVFHGKSIKPLLYGNHAWDNRVIVTDSQRIAYPAKWRKSAVMTERWRLINGKELYDINEDREQRNNIADKYPGVVKKLRVEYERWWNKVSEKYNRQISVVPGNNPVVLTSHDMRNEECDTAWNQLLVRKGIRVSGYWEVEIEEDGEYRFELRRWPSSEERAISSGIAGNDVDYDRVNIDKGVWGWYTGGNSLTIINANICIQGIKQTKPVKTQDTAAIFTLSLKKGETVLDAWFDDGQKSIASAYYVNIIKQTGEF